MKRVANGNGAAGGLSELEIKALAKGLVNYLRTGFGPEMMEKLVKPELDALERRVNELEGTVRSLVQGVAGRHD
jgi:hypothetical protein